MKHTPTPWSVLDESGDLLIIGKTEWTGASPVIAKIKQSVFDAESGTSEADAAFIVAACNSHEELLEALKKAYTKLQRAVDYYSDPELFDEISAALEKIEGE